MIRTKITLPLIILVTLMLQTYKNLTLKQKPQRQQTLCTVFAA